LALTRVSPRSVAIAWHRDHYPIPAAETFIALSRSAAEREQQRARQRLRK
jgi:hypothetical protein